MEASKERRVTHDQVQTARAALVVWQICRETGVDAEPVRRAVAVVDKMTGPQAVTTAELLNLNAEGA